MCKQPIAKYHQLLGYLGLGILLGLIFYKLPIQQWLIASLLWVRHLGGWGVFAFIGLYNVATVLFVPGSLLTLGGGALYGLVWGSIYVFIAATFGATTAFLLGRYLSRQWVAQRLSHQPKFRAIQAAVARSGFRIVLLTRLSPLFPFNLLNYAFGITTVSVRDYILGSVGMLPGTVLYVYLGALIGDVTLVGQVNLGHYELGAAQWWFKLVGLAATIGVTAYVTKLARQALQWEINQTNQALEQGTEQSIKQSTDQVSGQASQSKTDAQQNSCPPDDY